jgi:hypothetical protein
MKRTTVLYAACLGAFVSMSCSQAGPGTPTAPTEVDPIVRTKSGAA